MIKNVLEFSDYIARIFPEMKADGNGTTPIKTVTFQVSEDCNLRCSYCFEINKKHHMMTFDVAKAFIDNIIENRFNKNYFINEYNTKGLIIEFFGGEPLMNVKLMTQITEYWEKFFVNNPECPWTIYHAYNMSTNGTLYFSDEFQSYLDKYQAMTSVGVTVDGCKEAHDECRLFPDGSPSYDLAIAAALDAKKRGNVTTKITLAPGNVKYIYKSIVNMIELGYEYIHVNCAFEEGWELKDAQIIYEQFKLVADYIKSHDLYDTVYVIMLDSDSYAPVTHEVLSRNWCGTVGNMLALQWDGTIYTCCRFMPISLGDKIKDYHIGKLPEGVGNDELSKEHLCTLSKLTTESQSEQKCKECPIGSGCSFCVAYNYQHFGEFKRTTYICQCHKAAALATLYLNNIVGDKEGFEKIHVTKDIATEIISEDEWNKISTFGYFSDKENNCEA